MQQLRTVALVASLVIGLTACGGSKGTSTADVKADVAAQLAESGLDAAASKCVAGVMVDEIGADKVKDIDFSADAPPADQQEEFSAAAIKALTTCKIDAGSLGG
jgi:hypothetical protein